MILSKAKKENFFFLVSALSALAYGTIAVRQQTIMIQD